MANSLFPAFVRLFYHTAFGQHVQTIPTRAWGENLGTNGVGGYLNHVGGEVDALTMITGLVTQLKEFQPASCIYDSFIIYTQASELAIPQPRKQGTLTIAGTSASADVPASQATMSMRTSLFGLLKLVWFDAAPATDFLPQRTLPAVGQPLGLFNAISSVNNAWEGRDSGRPTTFLQISYTLNEALRRQYRLN